MPIVVLPRCQTYPYNDATTVWIRVSRGGSNCAAHSFARCWNFPSAAAFLLVCRTGIYLATSPSGGWGFANLARSRAAADSDTADGSAKEMIFWLSPYVGMIKRQIPEFSST